MEVLRASGWHSQESTGRNNVVAAPKIESAVSENVTKDPVLSPFADVFQGIGCLPREYSIELNKDVQPVVHPPPPPHEEKSACS